MDLVQNNNNNNRQNLNNYSQVFLQQNNKK